MKFNLWNDVASQDNPADLITRFESVDLNNSLSLDGPQLLRYVEQYLDKTMFVGEATYIGKMRVKPQRDEATMGILSKSSEKTDDLGIHVVIDIGISNSVLHLMKVTAWVLRFIREHS